MKRAPGAIGFLFVCLFWNGIVGVFDFVLLRGAYMERRARTTFESVEATVLSSRVSSSTSDGSTTYRPNVRYRYTVAGQDFESDRISYSVFGSSDRDYAYGTVDDYPVGAQVEALVDPANPSEAVLDASGAHLPSGVLLFLTPFHCIGFGILLGFLKALRRRRTDGEERRARFVRVENERHVVIGRPLASAMRSSSSPWAPRASSRSSRSCSPSGSTVLSSSHSVPSVSARPWRARSHSSARAS
ncbi:MAG: DUF3592 domain-containing protein [Planctomycetota bacterium]